MFANLLSFSTVSLGEGEGHSGSRRRPSDFIIPCAPLGHGATCWPHIPWSMWEQTRNNSFEGLFFHISLFDTAFFYHYRAPNHFPCYFQSSLQGRKKKSIRVSGMSVFHKERKVELSASLIKPRMYVRAFISIQLKCPLLGNGEHMEIMPWKGLTLRTGCRGSNVASALPPFHRTPGRCALRRADSSRFYKYPPGAL